MCEIRLIKKIEEMQLQLEKQEREISFLNNERDKCIKEIEAYKTIINNLLNLPEEIMCASVKNYINANISFEPSFRYPFSNMSKTAYEIKWGGMCGWCGVLFCENHGYPVLCWRCWNSSKPEEHEGFKRATQKELIVNWSMEE